VISRVARRLGRRLNKGSRLYKTSPIEAYDDMPCAAAREWHDSGETVILCRQGVVFSPLDRVVDVLVGSSLTRTATRQYSKCCNTFIIASRRKNITVMSESFRSPSILGDNTSFPYDMKSTTVITGMVDGSFATDIIDKSTPEETIRSNKGCTECSDVPNQVLFRQKPGEMGRWYKPCRMSNTDAVNLLKTAEEELSNSDKPVEQALIDAIHRTAEHIAGNDSEGHIGMVGEGKQQETGGQPSG
jgi:hypothetical protein